MSYRFSYGPFFHTAIKAEITTGSKSSFMVGISNPTDLKTASGKGKFAIAQFATATKNHKIKIFLNYQGGEVKPTTKLNQFDAVVTYVASKKFNIAYNGTIQFVQNKVAAKMGKKRKLVWKCPISWL